MTSLMCPLRSAACYGKGCAVAKRGDVGYTCGLARRDGSTLQRYIAIREDESSDFNTLSKRARAAAELLSRGEAFG